MICINDEYADGRDMSWLWDVDFTSLRGTGVKAVSGVREPGTWPCASNTIRCRSNRPAPTWRNRS